MLGTAVIICARQLLAMGQRPQRQPPPQTQQQPQDQQDRQQGQDQQQDNRHHQQRQAVQQGDQRNMWQQHRAQHWQSDHHSWQQRGGYDGYRIPDQQINGRFGRNHGFRISRQTVALADGRPHFQYGGYWFGMVDPWPENWSGSWYDNDDVYIDYSNDGYYLYNRKHPGVGLALSVSLE